MQFLNQLIQFLQQGIAAIFKFVQMIWTWSIGQITQVLQSPWQNWPLWKQVLLVLVLAAVVFALFKVAMELWERGRARARGLRHPARRVRADAAPGRDRRADRHGWRVADQQPRPVVGAHPDRVQLAVGLRWTRRRRAQ